MYMIGYNLGYYMVFIAFAIFAVCVAKHGRPWLWLGIGSVLQLISLLGASRQVSLIYGMSNMESQWGIFVGLLIFAVICILIRRNNEDKYEDPDQGGNG